MSTVFLPQRWLVLLLVGISVTHPATSLASPAKRSIDPIIEKILNDYILNEYLPRSNTNGLGLAIVHNDGEILYTNGYGVADIENQKPVANDTQFIIGSLSKMFTAAALTKVLQEKFPELGESVLDTPIRQLFPETNFTLIDRYRSEHGTIRDLLGHRMCFSRSETDWPQIAEAIDSRDEMIYRQRYVQEMCGMRSDFQYSNQMVVIAGELLAHLTNKRYEDAVGDLFQELGMLDTTFVSTSDDFSKLPYRAQPYFVKNGENIPVNPGLLKRIVVSNAAGGIITSSNDITKFLQLHLNLGKVDGKQVIPEEVIKWIHKPAIHTSPIMKPPPNNFGYSINSYGLALIMGTFGGNDYFTHSGGFTPYSSLISLFPAKKLGIFTTTNYGPVYQPQMILHTFIHELLKGNTDAAEKASEFGFAIKLERDELKLQQQRALKLFLEESKTFAGGLKPIAEEIVGKYGSGSHGEAEISEKWNNETNQTELFLTYGKWGHGWMEHVEGITYKIHFVTDLIQDEALGFPASETFIRAFNETLEFFGTIPGSGVMSFGKFQVGVSLDKLPPIPWLPGSC